MANSALASERDSEEDDLAPLDPSLGLFATESSAAVDDIFGDFNEEGGLFGSYAEALVDSTGRLDAQDEVAAELEPVDDTQADLKPGRQADLQPARDEQISRWTKDTGSTIDIGVRSVATIRSSISLDWVLHPDAAADVDGQLGPSVPPSLPHGLPHGRVPHSQPPDSSMPAHPAARLASALRYYAFPADPLPPGLSVRRVVRQRAAAAAALGRGSGSASRAGGEGAGAFGSISSSSQSAASSSAAAAASSTGSSSRGIFGLSLEGMGGGGAGGSSGGAAGSSSSTSAGSGSSSRKGVGAEQQSRGSGSGIGFELPRVASVPSVRLRLARWGRALRWLARATVLGKVEGFLVDLGGGTQAWFGQAAGQGGGQAEGGRRQEAGGKGEEDQRGRIGAPSQRKKRRRVTFESEGALGWTGGQSDFDSESSYGSGSREREPIVLLRKTSPAARGFLRREGVPFVRPGLLAGGGGEGRDGGAADLGDGGVDGTSMGGEGGRGGAKNGGLGDIGIEGRGSGVASKGKGSDTAVAFDGPGNLASNKSGSRGAHIDLRGNTGPGNSGAKHQQQQQQEHRPGAAPRSAPQSDEEDSDTILEDLAMVRSMGMGPAGINARRQRRVLLSRQAGREASAALVIAGEVGVTALADAIIRDVESSRPLLSQTRHDVPRLLSRTAFPEAAALRVSVRLLAPRRTRQALEEDRAAAVAMGVRGRSSSSSTTTRQTGETLHSSHQQPRRKRPVGMPKVPAVSLPRSALESLEIDALFPGSGAGASTGGWEHGVQLRGPVLPGAMEEIVGALSAGQAWGLMGFVGRAREVLGSKGAAHGGSGKHGSGSGHSGSESELELLRWESPVRPLLPPDALRSSQQMLSQGRVLCVHAGAAQWIGSAVLHAEQQVLLHELRGAADRYATSQGLRQLEARAREEEAEAARRRGSGSAVGRASSALRRSASVQATGVGQGTGAVGRGKSNGKDTKAKSKGRGKGGVRGRGRGEDQVAGSLPASQESEGRIEDEDQGGGAQPLPLDAAEVRAGRKRTRRAMRLAASVADRMATECVESYLTGRSEPLGNKGEAGRADISDGWREKRDVLRGLLAGLLRGRAGAIEAVCRGAGVLGLEEQEVLRDCGLEGASDGGSDGVTSDAVRQWMAGRILGAPHAVRCVARPKDILSGSMGLQGKGAVSGWSDKSRGTVEGTAEGGSAPERLMLLQHAAAVCAAGLEVQDDVAREILS